MAPPSPPQLTEALADQLVTAILVLDGQLIVRYANAAADAIFAASARRLEGTPVDSHLRYSSFDLALLPGVLQSQQTLSDSDVTWVFHDGKSVNVELTASVAEVPGQGLTILLEMRQIDLIRRINQEQTQQHQLAAAQQLVRGLAHEIKNPLGGLRGAAQLLDAELPESQREFTQLIMAQADRLRNLVDRLLGPNRPSERRQINIHEVLARVLDLIQLECPANVSIRKDYDPSVPPLWISPEQIEQVLLNLVKNALEAVGTAGQIVVRTRVSHQETIYGTRYRQCLLITVQDDGPGVPAELRDTLFYPLVTGRENGSGLGLSIAQSLVHQHAGKIEVSSRPQCTEFTVYLPYQRPEVEDAA